MATLPPMEPADAARPGDDHEVVVHSSLRGLAAAAVAPTALIALGGAALQNGFRWLPATILLAGSVLAFGVLLDFPRRTRFAANGIVRICPVRAHHIPWSDAIALERAPATTVDRVRALKQGSPDAGPSGGLVARGPGRRRWLLTDRVESELEYDALAALLAVNGTSLRAARPRTGTPPTDLYRRRR